MPVFSYKAMNPDGRVIFGQMDALNPVDLEMRLKRMELDFIRGEPAARSVLPGSGRVPRAELITFVFHLEQLVRAGVPILEALVDLRDSIAHPRLREVTASLVESIEGGRTLSQAMGEHGRVFDRVVCALVRAGENTGNVPEVLKNLTEALKWEDELASQTRQALAYPAFTAVVVLVVVGVLMAVVVPDLARFMRAAGQAIPWQMQAMLTLSELLQRYWLALLLLMLAAALGLTLAVRSSTGLRYRLDAAKLRLPLYGPILRKVILSRFASVFSMLYAAGIPIIDAVRTTEDVVGNRTVREGLRRAGRLIGEGQNVTQAFHSVGLFPPLVIRMLRVGEATGGLDAALLNVAYFYNREVRDAIARVQARMGPALTLILGLIVLSIALAVLGPIYDMLTRIQ
jgi:type IV pilus assembly protein PilC